MEMVNQFCSHVTKDIHCKVFERDVKGGVDNVNEVVISFLDNSNYCDEVCIIPEVFEEEPE